MIFITPPNQLLLPIQTKVDQQGKLKIQLTLRTIKQLRRDLDILKAQLRTLHSDMKQVENQQIQFKKQLDNRNVQIDKLKRQAVVLHSQGQKLANQSYRIRSQQDQTLHQIKRCLDAIEECQKSLREVTAKISEVKVYIGELAEDKQVLNTKLKAYQIENTQFGSNLDQKEQRLDHLSDVYASKHAEIKGLVENYIELEHLNEKNMKETKHKLNVVKLEGDKGGQLTNALKKTQKSKQQRQQATSTLTSQCNQISQANNDFSSKNQQLKHDLVSCQRHLQNLLERNAYIQQQMELNVREDENIIAIIRRKKLLPSVGDFRSSRRSMRSGLGMI